MFATPGDLDNYDESLGVNSAVKYASPSYVGFQWEGMYALGGAAGSMSSGQTYSLAAAYGQGPLNVAAGYFHGRYGRKRVVLLHEDGVNVPTNLAGIAYVPFPTGHVEAGLHVLRRELDTMYGQ